VNKTSFKEYWNADFYRRFGKFPRGVCTRTFISRKHSTMKFILAFRLLQFSTNIVEKKLFSIILDHYAHKFQFEIPYTVKIGKGLRLPHYAGGIVMHPNVVIGDNVEILQGVTIGNNILKSRDDVAKIGNNVNIGAGAKIIGPVTIGDNVVIGANAVVVSSIEPNCAIGGVPAKVIKSGVSEIVLNSDY